MTPRRILVTSEARDPHAAAVAWALGEKGHLCERLLTPDFPSLLSLSMHVEPEDRASRFVMRGPGVAASDQSRPFDTVWLRRQPGPVLPEDMHAGDREIATQQCESFLAGLVAYLDQGGETFWVNPIQSEAAARHKPYQLRKAVKAGLAIPETLFSNDPDEIRSFLRAHGGVVAHKLLESATWVSDGEDDGQIFAAHTVPVREDQLPDDDVLRLCPGIFQPFLEKRFEVRVACLGDFLVALRIDSQADDRAASDWRLGQLHVDMVPYDLPLEVQQGCRRLLHELGLPHASLDFVVDKSGDHIFLEANPQGQFLFLETRARLPLLDMFSEFLLAGTRAFTWRDDHEVIRYEDWKEVWKATWPAEAAEHVVLHEPLGAPDSA